MQFNSYNFVFIQTVLLVLLIERCKLTLANGSVKKVDVSESGKDANDGLPMTDTEEKKYDKQRYVLSPYRNRPKSATDTVGQRAGAATDERSDDTVSTSAFPATEKGFTGNQQQQQKQQSKEEGRGIQTNNNYNGSVADGSRVIKSKSNEGISDSKNGNNPSNDTVVPSLEKTKPKIKTDDKEIRNDGIIKPGNSKILPGNATETPRSQPVINSEINEKKNLYEERRTQTDEAVNGFDEPEAIEEEDDNSGSDDVATKWEHKRGNSDGVDNDSRDSERANESTEQPSGDDTDSVRNAESDRNIELEDNHDKDNSNDDTVLSLDGINRGDVKSGGGKSKDLPTDQSMKSKQSLSEGSPNLTASKGSDKFKPSSKQTGQETDLGAKFKRNRESVENGDNTTAIEMIDENRKGQRGYPSLSNEGNPKPSRSNINWKDIGNDEQVQDADNSDMSEEERPLRKNVSRTKDFENSDDDDDEEVNTEEKVNTEDYWNARNRRHKRMRRRDVPTAWNIENRGRRPVMPSSQPDYYRSGAQIQRRRVLLKGLGNTSLITPLVTTDKPVLRAGVRIRNPTIRRMAPNRTNYSARQPSSAVSNDYDGDDFFSRLMGVTSEIASRSMKMANQIAANPVRGFANYQRDHHEDDDDDDYNNRYKYNRGKKLPRRAGSSGGYSNGGFGRLFLQQKNDDLVP